MTHELLSPDEAFRAMFKFLENYYLRAGQKGDLAAVLSDIQISDDRLPADPAAWNNWLDAVKSVLETPACPPGREATITSAQLRHRCDRHASASPSRKSSTLSRLMWGTPSPAEGTIRGG